MTGVTTRFAPSPTGLLHLGHAYAAGFAAQQAGRDGRFLLRIEDIDPTRCHDEFLTAIYEDLRWLGLRWPEPVLQQSQNFPAYQAALEQLQERGLLYPCFCTRKTIEAEIAAAGHAPHGPEGTRYPRICKGLSLAERQERIGAGAAHCWRLDMLKAIEQAGTLTWHDAEFGTLTARPADFGDIVLARKETPAAYHLAVVVDDAAQGVTLVTRGQDLLRATDVHRLLQALLGLPYPHYHHHKLLTDASGKRYAKRDQSVALRSLRQKGLSPVTIWQELALIVA